MAELKNYVEGQPIEPRRPIVYTTIEEQAELKAYREFGDLSQLRALCDNYHELLNELRNRPTEAEIRAKIITAMSKAMKEFYPSCKGAYVDFDVFFHAVMARVAEKMEEGAD